MSTRFLSDGAQVTRAARHLIENHGSRAAAVATKRAAHLYHYGEHAGADTWRKIGDFVRAIEVGKDLSLHKTNTDVRSSTVTVAPSANL